MRPLLSLLVCDSDVDFAATLTKRLEAAGYAVSAASNGSECLSAVKVRRMDVVLVDSRLPDLSAGDVARAIRSVHFRPTRMPVLIAINHGLEDRAMAQKAGFHFVIAKPVDMDVLDTLLTCVRVRRILQAVGNTEEPPWHRINKPMLPSC